MGFWQRANASVRQMTVIDVGLIKWSVFFATIIVVKIFPQLLQIHYAALVACAVLCGARPLYLFWFKK